MGRNSLKVDGAKIIAERASDLAPKHTGRLSASIKVRSATGQFAKAQNINVGKGSVGVVVATGTREELGIPADEKSYYPSSQEFGWTPKKGPQAGQYFPGKPYMRPALDEKRDQARAKAAAIIADGIEREAKRG